MQSDRGINYILMAYHYDANNILTTPLKNRTGIFILSVMTKINDKLRKRGLTSKLHIMDNEVSEDLKKYFEDSEIQFQLVPPHMHRKKCCRKGYENFQEPLYCCHMQCGPYITILLMGPSLVPSHHDTQYVAAIPIKRWAISL